MARYSTETENSRLNKISTWPIGYFPAGSAVMLALRFYARQNPRLIGRMSSEVTKASASVS
jgi:hypothetical protein